VVRRGLTGAYNVVSDAVVPPTNREMLDAQGWPPLVHRGEIATPAVPVSSAKLRGAGFEFASLPSAG
jgi:hypothetical protein